MAFKKIFSDVGKISRVFFSSLIFLLASCGQVNSGGSGSSVYNPPVGVVDNSAGFYMRYLRNANYTYVDHAGSLTPTAPCVAVAGQKVFCYVEAQELDLWYNGVTLQFNVPSTMCSYVSFEPYWYYFAQPGVGPTVVHADTDQNGNLGYDSDSNGVIGNVPADLFGQTTCAYNYSTLPVPGPNCCIGSYTLLTRTWNSSAAPPAYGPTTVTQGTWGGQGYNCLAGPAKDSVITTGSTATSPTVGSGTGYPSITYEFVQGTGLNATFPIIAPIKATPVAPAPKGFIEYAANYYTNAESGAAPPLAVKPAGGFPSSPFYDLRCLDNAHEVTAEILMLVRKWNTGPQFANLLSDPTQFNFGAAGLEPAPWASDPLDDFLGWLELGNSFPGTTNGTHN